MKNLLDFLLRYDNWFTFIICEVISLVMLFSYNSYQGSVWFSSANAVAGKVYEVNSSVEQYFSLTSVNKDLTQRNILLEQQVRALSTQLTRQTGDSAFMMQSDAVKALGDFSLIPAKVVSITINKADNLITIDKGEADGIRQDMGVTSGTGIVGIVLMAGQHYSVVMPILNSKSKISCMIQKRGYFGFLNWTGGDSRTAYLEDVPRHAHFRLYDHVVTSGYSSVFPPGMMVGKIMHVFNSPDGLSYRCQVQLTTDFGSLRDVCVIDNSKMVERIDILRQAQDSLEKK